MLIMNRVTFAVSARRVIMSITLVIALLYVALITIFGPSAHAITTISQSYQTESAVSVGSIVSLKDNSTTEIVPSSSSTVDNLIGIVINAGSALLALSGGTNSEVQVATSGTVDVLVSNINGDVEKGNHITASPILGVGMKATDNIRIAGIAQADLTEVNGRYETYTDDQGIEEQVLVGQIPIIVNVSYYFKEPDRTIIPSALQNLANALAGKEVSTLPIILSSAVFLIMLVVVASIIYSMIHSSIISVGRNPLSQSAIYRDLIQVSALVIGILGVGLIAIYLILTRL